jgi:type VI secretion system protein ImpF
MARPPDPRLPSLSVLDRLIDEEPGGPPEPPMAHSQAVRILRAAISRDIELLLNARLRPVAPAPEYEELAVSLLNYGLPDLNSVQFGSLDGRRQMRTIIEQTLRRFEPRLRRPEVTILDNTDPLDRTLRFRIEGFLDAQPAPITAIFDSRFEPLTRTVEIKAFDDG